MSSIEHADPQARPGRRDRTQGRDRTTKKVSWPFYLTTAIKANKVPRAILVVLCCDPREAARCRRVISTGHPGFDLYPIVVDPATFPSREDAGP